MMRAMSVWKEEETQRQMHPRNCHPCHRLHRYRQAPLVSTSAKTWGNFRSSQASVRGRNSIRQRKPTMMVEEKQEYQAFVDRIGS